ncbi:hypothetical protein AWC17_17370 [Mycobacterium nebraskense]|uniref:Uncharacterized protein n=1 Tax=Mycobacterium nebraskense TaxID=244292 RepID=A0A1X1YVV7_9MYCO|nr:hypothetical protein WU83_28455 [Mycobacterium nebraskense]ORW15218.1 hypothetical protein AWC17_17370 [Mycobacterium nebraskense]
MGITAGAGRAEDPACAAVVGEWADTNFVGVAVDTGIAGAAAAGAVSTCAGADTSGLTGAGAGAAGCVAAGA